MEESPVKTILTGLRVYLHNNLRIDESFISSLSAAGLLGDSDADILRSSVSQGGHKALCDLVQHMEWYYDQKMLEKFCMFLDDYSKPAKPRLGEIAERIRQEMENHQPGSIHQPVTQKRNGVPGPTSTGPPSSPTATQGEPTPTVSTMDEGSQKIEEIVDMYRSESTKVSLPEIPELEDDFDEIMGTLSAKLSSADPQVICKLVGMVRLKYRRYIHGVKPGKVPSIPNTASGLCEFISEKSTPYEILLVHHAVEALDMEDLKGTLQSYESNLGNHLRRTLESYKKRKVTLPLRKDHTHLAVVLSKEQTLLSLVLHIKEYLMKYLQLEETIFEGFGEGCTVLFYSILKVDAVLLAPKVLSYLAELKRMFDITHLVVFDYFACDLERATIELLERDMREAALKEDIAALKTTLEEKELQLKNTLQQKDAQLKQKDAQLREKDAELKQQHTLLQGKDAELRHKDEESGRQYAVLLEENQQLQQECDQLRHERDQLQSESSRSLSAKPENEKPRRRLTLPQKIVDRLRSKPSPVTQVEKKPPRNWKNIKYQKILKCGGWCQAVATKENHIAVGAPQSVEVYDRSSAKLLHTIGKSQLGDVLFGVTSYDQENILVSDYSNDNIKVFTIQGQHVQTIDRGSTTFKPLGITVSPDGHIYVCDGANHSVCAFDVNRKFLFSFGSRGSGDECFDRPRDLCFARDGFLYITDARNSRICVYDKDGKFIRNFTTTYQPTCIAATDCGHLIVSSVSHKVMVYTTGGDLVHAFGERGNELGQFFYPTGISVDSDGSIYIADCGNHRIQIF